MKKVHKSGDKVFENCHLGMEIIWFTLLFAIYFTIMKQEITYIQNIQ